MQAYRGKRASFCRPRLTVHNYISLLLHYALYVHCLIFGGSWVPSVHVMKANTSACCGGGGGGKGGTFTSKGFMPSYSSGLL